MSKAKGSEQIFTNARIVTRDAEFDGTVVVRDGLIVDYPILLLDEPTASLDADNRDRVVELIGQRRDAGSALVGIFHDVGVRELLANRVFEVTP